MQERAKDCNFALVKRRGDILHNTEKIMSYAIPISEERYNGIKNTISEIEAAINASGAETIAEFVECCGNDFYIDEEAEDYCTIDDDGDIYTITCNDYGLEVENEVKLIDPFDGGTMSLQIRRWEEC